MAQTYQPRSSHRVPTMSVRELVEHLLKCDQDAQVVFKSPEFGCFGSGVMYSIDQVGPTHLPSFERQFAGGEWVDDETGETVITEPSTEIWPAWSGVVIG